MSDLIVNPEIPYVGNVSGKLEPGKICRIQGVTLPQIDRFTINLQTGPNAKPRDDTALHISIRISQGYIARNSYINGEWGDEQGAGTLKIGPGQTFEILILTDTRDYKVAVNGEHFCEFPHRIPFENVSHLLIDGDVNITLVSWELSVPVAVNQPVSEPSPLNTNSSQQFNAGQYFPPNNYQPQPQGPYGGPGQYGPPVPPGAQAQSESGFGGFLEQAQEALVGAIKSGAAEKLFSGLLSTGEKPGYAPQNAQYGIYPQLPPPDDNFARSSSQSAQSRGPLETFLSGLLSNANNPDQANQNAHIRPEQPGNPQFYNQAPADPGPQSYGQYPGPPPQQQQNRGPLENLLSGLLPSGTNQQGNVNNPPYQQPQQPHLPQVGGEGSLGGLGSMGGLLSNLAGQILHNPKGN
ncbi:galectin-4 isoform X1 [Anoplophora glabripennis]|nr:galectin-4 isoform X1 [Anoplophora glabripennis]